MQEIECHPEATFAGPTEAQAALNAFCRDLGYAIVVLRRIPDKHVVCRRVIYACDRHGHRKKTTSRPGSARRPNAASRRNKCPMRVNLYRGLGGNVWALRYVGSEIFHNHAPSLDPSSHPILRRADLNQDIRNAIVTDAQTGTRAAQTPARLVNDNPSTLIRTRDIYNQQQREECARVGNLTRMQYLIQLMSDGNYHVAHQYERGTHVSHLFFALNETLVVYKDNPDAILMDCTYKTNRFDLPLLNMIGLTGMNTTIHLAQAFMRGETFDDYHWALSQLRIAMEYHRDKPLLNALQTVFPAVPVLLCLWHVIKDVASHARTHSFPQVADEERSRPRTPKWMDSTQHREFCDVFITLTRARTGKEYDQRRLRLQQLSAVESAYIDEVWLDIWKRRMVRVWTNSVVHFDLKTTSRVEGYERRLVSSQGYVLSIHGKVVHWWRQTLRKHLEMVSDTQIKTMGSLRTHLFSGVTTVIHNHAFFQCLAQLSILRAGICSGIYTKTTGLPCVQKLRQLLRDKAQLKAADFHPHWWVMRGHAPVPASPMALDPISTAERQLNEPSNAVVVEVIQERVDVQVHEESLSTKRSDSGAAKRWRAAVPTKLYTPSISMHGYAHQATVLSTIRKGIMHPFRDQLQPERTHQREHHNHKSAQEMMNAFHRSVREGQDAGTYLVVSAHAVPHWKQLMISPFGCVAKADADPRVEARVIHDLSYPSGTSTNDLSVQDALPELAYSHVGAIARRIESLKDCYPELHIKMMRGDVKSAFRHLFVHPSTCGYFAGYISAHDAFVIDMALPFGWTGSPAHYGAFGSAISFLVRRESPSSIRPEVTQSNSPTPNQPGITILANPPGVPHESEPFFLL